MLTNSLPIVLTRATTGERIELSKDSLIGRSRDCDIVLVRSTASRMHAKVTASRGKLWLEDLNSVHGTFVNDIQISSRVELSPGDRLRFGEEDFEIIAVNATLPLWPVPRGARPQVLAKAQRPPSVQTKVADPTARTEPPPAPGAPAAPKTPAAAVPVAPRGPAAPTAPHSPAAASAPRPSAAASAPRPSVAASAPRPSVAGHAFHKRRPGAWADSAQRPEVMSTYTISPEEMRERLAASEASTGAAPDVDVPHLLILTGSRASVAVPLLAGALATTEWSIGRASDLDVVIPDVGVSQLHARIVNDGKRWKVVDELSANGTFVNNKRSHVSYLSADDHVCFGPVECRFCLPAGDERGAGRSRWLAWTLGVLVVLGALAAGYYYFRL